MNSREDLVQGEACQTKVTPTAKLAVSSTHDDKRELTKQISPENDSVTKILGSRTEESIKLWICQTNRVLFCNLNPHRNLQIVAQLRERRKRLSKDYFPT